MEYSVKDDVYEVNSACFYDLDESYRENLIFNRELCSEMFSGQNAPLVTICFIAYNHLEDYTKPAIDALMKYTSHLDIELVLIDNGSSDGTFEYFKSINFPRKKIIHVSENKGASISMYVANKIIDWGKYLCIVPNDIIVTNHWLDNLLKCIESDENIGMVVPVSDYVSNYQSVDLQYIDYEDMQAKAEQFNKSDSRKWEERMVVIPTVQLIRSGLHRCYQVDYGFAYYFTDDDMSFQYRRMGYKLIVCGDTFVHHGGSIASGEQLQMSLKKGKELFKNKYFGIDAWEDARPTYTKIYEATVNNYCLLHIDDVKMLGVNTRCGCDLLGIKNALRLQEVYNVNISAVTNDMKYWFDLRTVCNGNILYREMPHEMYDFIVLGDCINKFEEPFDFINKLFDKLLNNGRLLFKYNNRILEKKPISYMEVYQHFVKRDDCMVVSVIHLSKSEDDREMYEDLLEKARYGDEKAIDTMINIFPDSCYFQKYSEGILYMIVERICL